MSMNHAENAGWLADRAQYFTYGDGADPATGAALATEGLVHAVLHLAEQLTTTAPDPVEPLGAGMDLTVYRAAHNGITLGHYLTRRAARQHCLASAQDSGMALSTPHWVPEDGSPGAEEELCRLDEDDDSVCTGYTVTPIIAWDAFDPAREG
jgi:hypothetical protein